MAVAASQMELWRGGLQAGSDKTSKKTRHEWGEDKHKVLQLMLGQFNQSKSSCVTTLDLLGSCPSKSSDLHQSLSKPGNCQNTTEAGGVVELDQQQSLPSGWEKCLDLKTGAVYYVNSATGSRGSFDVLGMPKQEFDVGATGSNINEKREGEGGTSLELKLNICSSENEKVLLGKRVHAVSDQSSSSLMFSPSASSSSSSCSPSCVSSETGLPTTIPIMKDDVAECEMELMVLVGCPRCLMYVMASGQDPKCPRCRSSVLLDFPTHAHSPSKRARTF